MRSDGQVFLDLQERAAAWCMPLLCEPKWPRDSLLAPFGKEPGDQGVLWSDMSSFNIWYTLITIAVVIAVLLGGGLYLVLLERKVSGLGPGSPGPNRVGMYGLIQPIAAPSSCSSRKTSFPGRVDKVLFWRRRHCRDDRNAGFRRRSFGRTTVPPDETFPFVHCSTS